MKIPRSANDWQHYLEAELNLLSPLLSARGYVLDNTQPHTQGERFLMQNITTIGGQKVILLGTSKDGSRVVIKATRDNIGKAELKHERLCRQSLHKINFAYQQFHSPPEVAFFESEGFLISVQQYIEQTMTFIERPIAEQFSFALKAFKAQESARATTKNHYQTISKVFGIRTSTDYLKLVSGFKTFLCNSAISKQLQTDITTVEQRLHTEALRVEQYCCFLTHTDFVPHNFRIKDDTLYLLDFSSLQFGNKHESWARFLNFMTLYNHQLEKLLIEYVEKNRAPEERESLQLMRLYRLVEIITYYQKTLERSQGALLELNNTRVMFWHKVLSAELKNERVPRTIVTEYQKTRDQLRSNDEQERQRNLH